VAKKAERRVSSELRVDGDANRIRGYAAIFDSETDIAGMFREQVARGAFARSIEDSADVRALIDHDSTLILGRTKSGTLRLFEDDRGLAVEIDLPDTQAARDLRVSLDRGDVSQMSFGFVVRGDEWQRGDGLPLRTLTDVDLFDVSVVTFPAYPETEAALRSLSRFQQNDHVAARTAARLRMKHGLVARALGR